MAARRDRRTGKHTWRGIETKNVGGGCGGGAIYGQHEGDGLDSATAIFENM